MRRIAVSALLLFVVILFPLHAEEKFSLILVKDVPAKKDAIYDGTLSWMAEKFISSKVVIQEKNKNLGVVVAHGAVNKKVQFIPFLPGTVKTYTFNLMVEIKDKEFRMIFNDVHLMTDDGPKPIETTDKEMHYPAIHVAFEEMADSLQTYLQNAKTYEWR
jgi:hypothetical protein